MHPNKQMSLLHEQWRKSSTYKIPPLAPLPGIGNHATPMAMILGCAPSGSDTIEGEPFTDPGGRVLRALANKAGFTQVNTWVTMLFKYRFMNNRLPYPDEIISVRHLLYTEWCAVNKPQLIIPVGPSAANAVLGSESGATVRSGRAVVRTSKCGLPMVVVPMVHPVHGLRDTSIRNFIERHWDELGEQIDKATRDARYHVVVYNVK